MEKETEQMRTNMRKSNPVREAYAKSDKTVAMINGSVRGAVVECRYRYGGEVLTARTWNLSKDSNIGFHSGCPVYNCDGSTSYVFKDIIEEAVKGGKVTERTISCNGNTDPIGHHPTARCQGYVDVRVTPLLDFV